jgi:hypothetical protein
MESSMPTLQIDSPANGSSVPPNAPFTVSVEWDSGLGARKAKRTTSTKRYSILCSNVLLPFETDDSSGTTGSTPFVIQSNASGSMIVTVTLVENTSPPTPLASDSITVNISASSQVGGSISSPPPPPPPPPHPFPHVKKKARRTAANLYVCGTYTPYTVHMICVTYQVVIDHQLPRDGVKGSPQFTISKKLKKVKQYSVNKGNLTMAGGKWQVKVKPRIADPADGYQIQVWFLDVNWVVMGTGSTALAGVVSSTPCP